MRGEGVVRFAWSSSCSGVETGAVHAVTCFAFGCLAGLLPNPSLNGWLGKRQHSDAMSQPVSEWVAVNVLCKPEGTETPYGMIFFFTTTNETMGRMSMHAHHITHGTVQHIHHEPSSGTAYLLLELSVMGCRPSSSSVFFTTRRHESHPLRTCTGHGP